MSDECLFPAISASSGEACREDLRMSSLGGETADRREHVSDPSSPAERLRRLEAFSAG